MALSLPDDLLVEILVRVEEAAALFRCATTCKRWRSLFADQSFLRQLWPNHHDPFSFIGFIAKDKRHGHRPEGGNGLVILAPRSGLGPRCRALRSFMPFAYTELLDGAVPLTSRRGLLLLRLGNSALRDHSDRTIIQLAVCNLLSSTCDVLPPLKLQSAYDDYEWCGYAIITDADCRRFSDKQRSLVGPNNSSFFKVMIIGSDEDGRNYSLYTFSSRKVGWSTRIGCIIIGVRTRRMPFSDVMVRRGMAHWLRSGFYLVTLNIQSGHLSCIKLRVPLNHRLKDRPWLTLAIDETLALLWMRNAGLRVEILAQQQNVGGNSEWLCTSMMQLKLPGDKETEKRGLYILGEHCGLLLVKDSRQHVYTTELETGMMEEVVDWPRKYGFIPWESLPLELNWPAFFISRLGVSNSVRDTGKKKEEEDGPTHHPRGDSLGC